MKLTEEEIEVINWSMCFIMNKLYPDAYLEGKTEFTKRCIKDRDVLRNLIERTKE